MLTASLIGTAVAIASVLGASITAYLWLVRRQQLLVSNGITSLAAMRWREFAPALHRADLRRSIACVLRKLPHSHQLRLRHQEDVAGVD